LGLKLVGQSCTQNVCNWAKNTLFPFLESSMI
jgi:hypothetical protein